MAMQFLDRPWFVLGGCGLLIISFALANLRIASLRSDLAALQERVKRLEPLPFNEWLVDHERTCPQCGGDDSNGPPALCKEAFRQLQQSIRDSRRTKTSD